MREIERNREKYIILVLRIIELWFMIYDLYNSGIENYRIMIYDLWFMIYDLWFI